MAAPKKAIVKDKQLKVKVTQGELEQIRLNAKKSNLNVSQYVLLTAIGNSKKQ
jgi:hemolysin activation/secretion protein